MKTVKEIVIEQYGSINNFIANKLKQCAGKLPMAREYIYKLLNHEVANPGIKSLNQLADLIGIERNIIYLEYSE